MPYLEFTRETKHKPENPNLQIETYDLKLESIGTSDVAPEKCRVHKELITCVKLEEKHKDFLHDMKYFHDDIENCACPCCDKKVPNQEDVVSPREKISPGKEKSAHLHKQRLWKGCQSQILPNHAQQDNSPQ